MNRTQRKAISLLMSVFLTVFSLCQVQAWAGNISVAHSEQAANVVAEMADCHRSSLATEAALPDCCSVCEQLTQHPDVSIKLTSLDHSPVILAIAEPYSLQLASSRPSKSYRPPDPLAVNPPTTIRYQRLLN